MTQTVITALTIISLILTIGSITLLILSLYKVWKYIDSILYELRKFREESSNLKNEEK